MNTTFFLQLKLFKAITLNGVTGAIALPPVGLGRSSEQGTVPIPLRRLAEWIVRLLGWTEMCINVRSDHALVSIEGYLFNTLLKQSFLLKKHFKSNFRG